MCTSTLRFMLSQVALNCLLQPLCNAVLVIKVVVMIHVLDLFAVTV